MIYDIFLYNGEKELLEIRLNVLKDIVNYFVVIESPLTFTGLEKPIYLKQSDFKEFPILHIVGPNIHHPFLWANEWFSRNLGADIILNAQPDDIILLSDVDEIPNPITLKNILLSIDTPVTFNQIYNFYKFNLECFTQGKPWPGTVATRAKYIKYPSLNPQDWFDKNIGLQNLREGRNDYFKIKNGGNHFSYCYNTEEIQRKIKSFCHAPELNNSKFNNPDHIAACIEKGESIWVESDGNRMKKIELNSSNTPQYILDNLDKYKHLIL